MSLILYVRETDTKNLEYNELTKVSALYNYYYNHYYNV